MHWYELIKLTTKCYLQTYLHSCKFHETVCHYNLEIDLNLKILRTLKLFLTNVIYFMKYFHRIKVKFGHSNQR